MYILQEKPRDLQSLKCLSSGSLQKCLLAPVVDASFYLGMNFFLIAFKVLHSFAEVHWLVEVLSAHYFPQTNQTGISLHA